MTFDSAGGAEDSQDRRVAVEAALLFASSPKDFSDKEWEMLLGRIPHLPNDSMARDPMVTALPISAAVISCLIATKSLKS